MKNIYYNRLAILFAALSVVFCVPNIASATGFSTIEISDRMTLFLVLICTFFWCLALCLLSKARGYYALWGLVLLFPPMILVYSIIFPDKNKPSEK